MRISDWSSDVCSSDLAAQPRGQGLCRPAPRFDDLEALPIAPESTRDAAIAALRRPDVDGVFVSCTSLQVAPIAREVEDATGKPLTSSNLAMAWHCLRLAGIDEPQPEFGSLFERGLG